MRAMVAVRADVDDKRTRLHLDLVCAEQEQNIKSAGRHMRGIKTAGARHHTEVQRSHARCSAVQHGKPVPTLFYRAKLSRHFCGKRGNGRAVLSCKGACAHENERTFGCFQRVRELAVSEAGKALSAGTKVLIIVGKIGLLADKTDREIAGPPALADARVKDGRLPARI